MNYQTGTLLCDYTTLKIGGPAKRFYQPETPAQAAEILKEAREQHEPVYILGNGSNVLFEDRGFNGWILQTSRLQGIENLGEGRVKVAAGVTNAQLSDWLAQNGLGGYEFASGIPGTVGGAVIMNAGAYGGEICDVLESVEWMDENGQVHETPASELDLSYRHSRFSDSFGIVLSAIFRFAPKDPDHIRSAMQDLHDKRWAKQPMEDASAGSTFKRPEKGYASALIHECGLQGLRVGDAMVSTKHAGFLINAGQATCTDFLELVSQVQKHVKEEKGVDLELEVRRVLWQDQEETDQKN